MSSVQDEALLRPGRLEVQVEIGLPDDKGRLQILKASTVACSASNAAWSPLAASELCRLQCPEGKLFAVEACSDVHALPGHCTESTAPATVCSGLDRSSLTSECPCQH